MKLLSDIFTGLILLSLIVIFISIPLAVWLEDIIYWKIFITSVILLVFSILGLKLTLDEY